MHKYKLFLVFLLLSLCSCNWSAKKAYTISITYTNNHTDTLTVQSIGPPKIGAEYNHYGVAPVSTVYLNGNMHSDIIAINILYFKILKTQPVE